MVALSPSFQQPASFPSNTTQKHSNTPSPSSSSSLSSSYSAKPPRFRVSSAHTAAEPMSGSSLYEVLGISTTATRNEIKAAYRRLARVCHPDAVAINKRESSACEFMRIHEAYSTLSDPGKRATYDWDLYGQFGAMNSSMVAATAAASMNVSSTGRFSGFSRRKWETDQCW